LFSGKRHNRMSDFGIEKITFRCKGCDKVNYIYELSINTLNTLYTYYTISGQKFFKNSHEDEYYCEDCSFIKDIIE
jgi:hypothetical protein